ETGRGGAAPDAAGGDGVELSAAHTGVAAVFNPVERVPGRLERGGGGGGLRGASVAGLPGPTAGVLAGTLGREWAGDALPDAGDAAGLRSGTPGRSGRVGGLSQASRRLLSKSGGTGRVATARSGAGRMAGAVGGGA